MKAPPRVLHVITSLERGGAEVALVRLIETSANANHVGVVTLRGGDTPLAHRITAAGVPVFHLGGAGLVSSWGRWRETVRATQAEVIHAWLIHPALLLCLLPSRPALVVGIHHSLHDLKAEKPASAAIIRSLALLVRRADRICYVSQAARLQHEAIGYPALKGVVIPNGFVADGVPAAPDGAKRLRRALGLDETSFLFGQVGRVHPVKGHDLLLRAFASIVGERPNIHLVLIGAGTDTPDGPIAHLVTQLGLIGRVHVLGERDDVPTLLSGLDCLVNPSRSEALPSVIAEAMLAHLPCIATTVGDTTRLLSTYGLPVRPGDVPGLADAMAYLASLPASARKEIGRASHDHIAHHFSLAAMGARYAAIYAEILE